MKRRMLLYTVILGGQMVAQTKPKVNSDSLLKFQTNILVTQMYDSLDKEVGKVNKQDNAILTGHAFNLLAAKNLASYLSSSADFSLTKAYALLDNTDGKVHVEGNLPVRRKNSKRLLGVVTLGAKSNIVEKVVKLYNNEKPANDISGEVKVTWLIANNIKYYNGSQWSKLKALAGGDQKEKMSIVRRRILQEQKAKIQKELAELIKSLDGMGTNDSIQILEDKIKSLSEDLADNYYKEEQVAFSKSPEKYSNSQKMAWLSVLASIPVTETKYSIAESYVAKAHDVNYYPFSGSGRLSLMFDRYKVLKSFWNVSYIVGKSNTLLDSSIDQSVITKTVRIDTSSVINSTSKTYFSKSGFQQYVTETLRGQVVLFPVPSKNSYIGIDFFGDLNIKNGDATWGFGIPVSLKDKDEKPLVNFELILNKINQPENRILSLSLAVPFGSIIY
ncbi:MAG: hypothetical protein ACJ77K_06700 [Bacteroidia bacterium]